MPNQHKHAPIPFRPPEGDRTRLLALAERTAQPVNRILSEALAAWLEWHDPYGPAHEAELSTATYENRR